MNPFTAIGKPTPLIDAPQKATGTAGFVSDIRVPDLLEGKVLRSPHPHARIMHIDVEEARKAPGVHAVVTGADAPKPRWGWSALQDQSILAHRSAAHDLFAITADLHYCPPQGSFRARKQAGIPGSFRSA